MITEGGGKGLPTDDDKHPHVDEDAFDPNDPGASKAGRGGVVSPGGKQPKPSEDPRKDAGLEPEAEPKDASCVIVPGIALNLWAC